MHLLPHEGYAEQELRKVELICWLTFKKKISYQGITYIHHLIGEEWVLGDTHLALS